jgi:hypothetical protein
MELAFAQFRFPVCLAAAHGQETQAHSPKVGSGIFTQPRANALDDKQFRRLTAGVAQLVLRKFRS